jgi:MscS family membrane protein
VLDQLLWIDIDALSDAPAGHADDGLAPSIDSAGILKEADPPIPVLLQRRQGRWRIHATVVSQVESLYDKFGFGPLGEYLPSLFFEVRILELELWQWLGMLLAVVVAYALGMLLSLGLLGGVRRLVARTRTDIDNLVLKAVSTPLSAVLTVALFYLQSLALRLSVPAQDQVARICQGLVLIAVTWIAIRLVDVVSKLLATTLTARGDSAAATIVPMGGRIVKVFLLVIAALSALQNLGFNITGLLAGVGIGGLAIAFALQKTIENFFGGVQVIADQPVQVGHFGRFGSWLGTVEAIGLRSTQIRTLDRTLVTIPNADFAAMEIENFTHRDRIRFHTILGLRYETSADQLRHVLAALKGLLVSHERVLPDPARIRFVGFGAFSLDLEVFAYVDTSDWNEFLEIREDLMLQVIDIVEASGTGFAFPSQTLYLGKDEGLNAERARAAEAEIRAQLERPS